MKIEEFLARSSKVTQNWIIAKGRWPIQNQLAKTLEELGELVTTKNNLQELEEGWDVIFTILTRFHLQDIDNYAIEESMISTLRKIETKAQTAVDALARCPECETIRERWEDTGPTNWYCPKCKAGSA